jgi:hypothetical protein
MSFRKAYKGMSLKSGSNDRFVLPHPPPLSDLLKSKQQYNATAPSRANTTLKPILKKREAVFQSDFDIPDAADLYYASQLSMPKLSSMPVPWVHSYPAPVGYYSLDNFHMREPMYSPAPMAAPNVPKKQTSLAWNEEVEVIPALSGSKYNRKPVSKNRRWLTNYHPSKP